jgi:hypothetical protein
VAVDPVDGEMPVEALVENAVESDSEAEIEIDPDKAVPGVEGPVAEGTGEVDEQV